MKTVAELLIDWSVRLESEIDTLLVDYSGIWEWRQNDPGSVLHVITGTPYAWEDLEPEGRSLQSRLLNDYARWRELSSAVLSGSAESVVRDLSLAQEHVHEMLDQSGQTYYANVGEARSGLEERFVEIKRILEPLRSGGVGSALVIPDTNALLHDPRLEDWAFEDFPQFELVLLPTVLSELDRLKVQHKAESVRGKADRLIRQIKEYRRRGPLTEGVPLRNGRSTIRAIAVEPRQPPQLTWLDMDNADDRILASVIETMRVSTSRPVVLITRDVNLQNKAEFARIPFIEPPDV